MQTELKQLGNELIIKDRNSQSEYYLHFMNNTGSYSEVAAGCSCINTRRLKIY